MFSFVIEYLRSAPIFVGMVCLGLGIPKYFFSLFFEWEGEMCLYVVSPQMNNVFGQSISISLSVAR